MTNGELCDKAEQLGHLAVLLWKLLPEEQKKEIRETTLPDFAVLADELEEYI